MGRIIPDKNQKIVIDGCSRMIRRKEYLHDPLIKIGGI